MGRPKKSGTQRPGRGSGETCEQPKPARTGRGFADLPQERRPDDPVAGPVGVTIGDPEMPIDRGGALHDARYCSIDATATGLVA